MLSSCLYPAYLGSEKKLTDHMCPQFGRHCFSVSCRESNTFRALATVLILSGLVTTKALSFRSSIWTILEESSLLHVSDGACATAVGVDTQRNASAKAAEHLTQVPKVAPQCSLMPSLPGGDGLGDPRPLDRVSQSHGFQQADKIPANVSLVPAQPEARGACVRVMILVPVLAPGR